MSKDSYGFEDVVMENLPDMIFEVGVMASVFLVYPLQNTNEKAFEHGFLYISFVVPDFSTNKCYQP